MDHSQAIQMAKAGDPAAIAQLMNRTLQPKGILAKVSRSGDRLTIVLESEAMPDAQILVPYLQASLTKLAAAGISQVQIRGLQRFATQPAWVNAFELIPPVTNVTAITVRSQPATPHPHPAPVAKRNPGRTLQALILGGAAVLLILLGANLRTLGDRVTNKPQNTASIRTTSPTAAADGSFRAPIIDRLSGIPVINVKFNGVQTYTMMVDTGASLTLVTAQMASDLNVKPAGSAVFQTPGGMVNLDWGMMASIEVEGAIIGNVPVIIGLPDMRVGLLGQDFLQLFEITIREDHIEFKPKPKQRENSKV